MPEPFGRRGTGDGRGAQVRGSMEEGGSRVRRRQGQGGGRTLVGRRRRRWVQAEAARGRSHENCEEPSQHGDRLLRHI
eukprot:747179-Hanusia_phi.AAC.3